MSHSQIKTFKVALIKANSFACVILMSATLAFGQTGHVLNGVGPVDQAWAGAGLANPQDALTALYGNPAAITSFDRSSFDVSLQLLMPSGEIESSVNAGAFGPFGPSVGMQGVTDSEAGPFPIPAIGYINVNPDSRWAFGLSTYGVGGFGVDHKIDPTNPITTPQPPNGLGFGSISSEFMLLQVLPTAAYRITENVSFGIAPTFNLSTLEVTPFPAAPPDDANGDQFFSYADAPRDAAFGIGVQAGLHFEDPSGLSLGATYKSTQFFQDLEFDAVDEVGNPRTLSFNLDYPMIAAVGLGYSGLDKFEFAVDAKYIDYENTDGFDQVGFDETGAVRGFGWNSIFTVAAGVQYEVDEKLPVRIGYAFNENPIADNVAFFNAPAPGIIKHHLAAGFSYELSHKVTASVAGQYGFKNDIEGPWKHPQLGDIQGTQASCSMSTVTVVAGFAVNM